MLTTTFDFSAALKILRSGGRVHRAGWNGAGKGMWVGLHDPSVTTSKTRHVQTMTLPFLYLRTAGDVGHLVPWLASQTDLLADDWMDAAEVWEAQRDKPGPAPDGAGDPTSGAA